MTCLLPCSNPQSFINKKQLGIEPRVAFEAVTSIFVTSLVVVVKAVQKLCKSSWITSRQSSKERKQLSKYFQNQFFDENRIVTLSHYLNTKSLIVFAVSIFYFRPF